MDGRIGGRALCGVWGVRDVRRIGSGCRVRARRLSLRVASGGGRTGGDGGGGGGSARGKNVIVVVRGALPWESLECAIFLSACFDCARFFVRGRGGLSGSGGVLSLASWCRGVVRRGKRCARGLTHRQERVPRGIGRMESTPTQ